MLKFSVNNKGECLFSPRGDWPCEFSFLVRKMFEVIRCVDVAMDITDESSTGR